MERPPPTLGVDAAGRQVARVHGDVVSKDLALVGQLVNDTIQGAVRRWLRVGSPELARGRRREEPPAYTMDNLRRVHPNSHRRWTDEDDRHLAERVRQGATVDELMVEFGRNYNAIVSRAARLGIPLDLAPEAGPEP